jgi:hypothetical protein
MYPPRWSAATNSWSSRAVGAGGVGDETIVGEGEIVGAAVGGDWGAAVGGAVEGTIVRGVVDGMSDGAVGAEVLDGATEAVSAVGLVCAAGWAWPAHALSTIPTNSARPSSDLHGLAAQRARIVCTPLNA